MRMWSTVLTPNVHMGRAEHGLGFDWWSILWERLSSLRRPDPRWVAEAPEWGVFVSFAVLDLWKDRRAPTLSHYILWLMRRRTRKTRRGYRSLNWIKTQAGKLHRRKVHTRPSSPVARLFLSALCRVRREWRLLRLAVSLVGSAIQADGPLLWIGMSLLVLLSLLWRAVTPWDLRPPTPRFVKVEEAAHWDDEVAHLAEDVGDEEVAVWDDEFVEGDDDWAWGLRDEVDDWEFPEEYIPHDQLVGGCADATLSATYGDHALEVDRILGEAHAQRVPNNFVHDCSLAAIHASGWRSAPPSYSTDRKDIGDLAVTLERAMRSVLKSGDALTRWIDGVRGSAKLDHLALRLFAVRRNLNIVIVQAGATPIVLIAPGEGNIKNEEKRAKELMGRTTVAVALCNGHYEAIRPVDERDFRDISSALLKKAVRAKLNPLALDQCPLSTSDPSGEDLESCLGKPEEDFCFCPVEGCKGGIVSQSDVKSFTRSGLLNHLKLHTRAAEYIPDHILSYFGFRRCVGDECTALLQRSQSACQACSAIMKEVPAPSIDNRLRGARPAGMPSLQEIGTTRFKLKGTCPPDLAHRYTLIFQRVLQEILVHQDPCAWTKFALFFTVLHRDRAHGRRTKVTDRRCFNSWKKDLDRWDAGSWGELWSNALDEVQDQPVWTPGDTLEARQKRSRLKAATGLPGQALTALTSDGLAPHGPATLEKLKGKHPTEIRSVMHENVRNPSGPADFTTKEVMEAISSMPRATAGGPSNLTGSLLRVLCNQKHTPGTLAALTKVLSSLAQGKAHREVAPFFAGAKLVALRKVSKDKPEDVRPIAVGDVTRRLIGKILANRLRKRAAEIFRKGNQVGVSTPRGSEAATAVVAQYARKYLGMDKVILKVDYHNAFNTVDRATFISAVERHIPEISTWVRWCYAGHTSLFYGEATLESQCGVQQGDPLGPILFSLAIAEMTERLSANRGLDGSIWYLDDGCIRGDPEAVLAAYDALVDSSSRLGLKVNRSKCELVTLAGDSAEDLRNRGFTIRDASDGHNDGFSLHNQNFDFLGIPIGTAEHCRKYMQSKLDKSKLNLNALRNLKDSQHAYYILRFCEGFCKMVFYMRGISCVDLGEGYLRDFDAEVDRCLATILHDEHGALPAQARLQAALPIAIGGLGIRRTVDHWPAAALASQAGSFKLAQQLDPKFEWDKARWKNAAEAYNTRVPASQHIDGDRMPSKAVVQQQLSSAIVDEQAAELKRVATSDRDRARLLSLQLPMSGTWLTATPSPPNSIPSAYFAGAARFRLGVAVHKPKSECNGCSRDGVCMDAFGDHTFSCGYMGHRTERHDALKHSFFLAADAAGLNPSLEKDLGFESGKRPADVFLPSGIMETRRRALDFTVVAPTLPTYVHRAAQHSEYAAKVAGEEKRKKHLEDCRGADVLFSPMVFEAFGGASEECNRVISQVAGLACTKDPGGDAPTEARLREHMSCAYQAAVGKSFVARGVLCTDINEHLPHSADSVQRPAEEDLRQMDSTYLSNPVSNLPEREPSVEVEEAEIAHEPRDYFSMPEKKVGGTVFRHNPFRAGRQAGGETPAAYWNILRMMADGACPDAETQAARLGLTHPQRYKILRGDSGFDALLTACSVDLKKDLLIEDINGETSHKELRRRAVEIVKNDRPDLADCISIPVKNWLEYMGTKSSDRSDARTWMDMVALAGAGEALECTIVIICDRMRPQILVPTKRAREALFVFAGPVDDVSQDWFLSPLSFTDSHLKGEILGMEPIPAPKSKRFCKSVAMMKRIPAAQSAPVGTVYQCRRCVRPIDGCEAHFKCAEGCERLVCDLCSRDSPFCPASQNGLADILSGNVRSSAPSPTPHTSHDTHMKGAERARSPTFPQATPREDDQEASSFLHNLEKLVLSPTHSLTDMNVFKSWAVDRQAEFLGSRTRNSFTVGDCLFDALAANFAPNTPYHSSSLLRKLAVAQVLRDAKLAARAGDRRSWMERKLREGCRDDTTWADETMIMGLCEVLEMTIILVSPGAVPKIYVPRLCAPHGALGLVFTGVIAGHFETLSLNVDAVKILCAAKPLRADTCLWEPTTGPFICRGCDGHSEGAEAESHFCTTCCTSCCVACRVSQDQVTCAGPPVPMDDQPDGPRGTRRGNEDPIDNGAPHVHDLMRFHETERGLLRLWWCVRAGVHEGALKDQWEREEELEVAEMVKRHEAEMRQAGVKEEEMDVDQTQTGATPVRHPAHPDETPPMPPSSQGDWEQAGATMQDLHQTDASPQPVTPPRFAEEPEDRESGFEGGVEGDVPPEEGEELRRRSAERRRLSEERQKQEREATEVLLRRARSESASRFVSAKAKSSEQRRETMQEKAMGVRSPAGAQPGSAKTSELTNDWDPTVTVSLALDPGSRGRDPDGVDATTAPATTSQTGSGHTAPSAHPSATSCSAEPTSPFGRRYTAAEVMMESDEESPIAAAQSTSDSSTASAAMNAQTGSGHTAPSAHPSATSCAAACSIDVDAVDEDFQ